MRIIYSITSPCGKSYIGQTVNLKRRLVEHKSQAYYKRPELNESFLAHGFDSHEVRVLHELPEDAGQAVADRYEELYISQYRDCGVLLFNMRDGGNHSKNSPDSNRKTSQALMGKYVGEKNPMFGVSLSEQARNKISTANKGRKWKADDARRINGISDETKRRMSEARKNWHNRKNNSSGCS